MLGALWRLQAGPHTHPLPECISTAFRNAATQLERQAFTAGCSQQQASGTSPACLHTSTPSTADSNADRGAPLPPPSSSTSVPSQHAHWSSTLSSSLAAARHPVRLGITLQQQPGSSGSSISMSASISSSTSTSSWPLWSAPPARGFHSWYYASRSQDHEIRTLDSLEAVEAYWEKNGHPPTPLPFLPQPPLKRAVGPVKTRPPQPSRLSHINLARLLHQISLMPQEGPLIENVEARMEALVREVCEQLKHRVKWMEPRYAGVALVALGRLGWAQDAALVDSLLARATARIQEAYTRDLARIANGLWLLSMQVPEGQTPPGVKSDWWPAAFKKAETAVATGKAPPAPTCRLLWCACTLQQPAPTSLLLAVAADAAQRPAAYADLHACLPPMVALQALDYIAKGSPQNSSNSGSEPTAGDSSDRQPASASGTSEASPSSESVGLGGPLRIRTPASELLQALSRWHRAAPDSVPQRIWELLSPQGLGHKADAAGAQIVGISGSDKPAVLASKRVAAVVSQLEVMAGAASLVPWRVRKTWLSSCTPTLQQLDGALLQVVDAMAPHQLVVTAAALTILEHSPSQQLSEALMRLKARTQAGL